jgi:capsular exopolysaccharide synthesis family protein
MLQVNLEKIQKLDFSSNEAYKRLRTNIMFSGSNIKVICITSCLPNEGKSNISFNLSVSFAESGKKILFIDADLRRSAIVGRYKPDQQVLGLTHYLSGQNSIGEILYETGIENLDMIFTGPVPPNPAELLGSEDFIDLLMIFRNEYDYIIIDTPPLGSVVDSAIVAGLSDGVIFVIETNKISYKFAQKTIKLLESGKCRILGAVLNKVDMNDMQYKYYGKKYKNYKKYDNQYYSLNE